MGVGTDQRKSTPEGRAKEPDLRRYYAHKLPVVDPADFDARVKIIRDGTSDLDVDGFVSGVDWTDEDGVSGTLVLQRPDPADPASLPVGRGQRVRLSVLWGKQWFRLWELRLLSPTVTVGDGTVTFPIGDELAATDVGGRDWLFRKDKTHKKGWTCDEITRFAARKLGIKIGKLTKGTVFIPRLKLEEKTFIALVAAAYEKEKAATGVQYVVRFDNGRLDVLARERNRVLHVIGQQAADISIAYEGKKEPVTVWTGKARIGKGKKARVVKFTMKDPRIIARLGLRTKVKDYGVLPDVKALRDAVQRDYAEEIRQTRTVDVTVPILPFLRKSDAVMVDLPAEGFKGERAFMYVTDVSHSIQGADRATSISLAEEDPYREYREQQDAKLRKDKREKRKARAS